MCHAIINLRDHDIKHYHTFNMKEDECGAEIFVLHKQARKPRSYASSKLLPTHSLTGVKCRATSVAKNKKNHL